MEKGRLTTLLIARICEGARFQMLTAVKLMEIRETYLELFSLFWANCVMP